VMKILFEERQYETATQLMSADNEADGIYLLISGVVSLTYPRFYLDNPELGEVYNSDNLKAVAEESNPLTDDGPRLDYVLAGGLINEQSLALGFPRRSHAVSDTLVSVSLSVLSCIFVCPPISVCVYISVCLSACLSGCLAVWLSSCLSVCLCVWLSVCASVCLSTSVVFSSFI